MKRGNDGNKMAENQIEKKDKDYLTVVWKMVEEVQYGMVSIVVQDGKVVQIEQNKKVRI